MSEIGLCRLCLQEKELQNSHIIPKFVFRWLKSTGGTDFLRFGGVPNRRTQDGIKHPILCKDCEQVLSVFEGKFKENLFDIVVSGKYPRGRYSDWLPKFTASIVWRVGISQEFRGVHETLEAEQKLSIQTALERWRQFIIGDASRLGHNELHFVPIGRMSDMIDSKIPSNWNRYTLRLVEYDLTYSENTKFLSLYAKLGPVAFFGHVVKPSQLWIGSKLAINSGSLIKKKLVFPAFLLNFFIDRAISSEQIKKDISIKQRAITEAEVLKNLDRVIKSDMFGALEKDMHRFGIDAVTYKKED